MKILKFLKFIPVIVYCIIFGIERRLIDYTAANPTSPEWIMPVAGISFILSVIVLIWYLVNAIRGKYSGKETIITALILMIIPLYPAIDVIMLGMIGLIIPFFGWLATIVVIAYLYSIVVMTGVVQVGSIVSLLKEKKISPTAGVICGLMSFCFVLDFFACIYLIIRAFKKEKQSI